MSMQISRVKGVKYHGHLAMCKYIVDSRCLLPGSPTKEINYRLMFGSTGVALQRWSINQDVTCRFLILKIKSYRIKFISLDFRVLFFTSQLHVRLQLLQRRQLPQKCLRYLARNTRRTKTKKRWAGDFRVFLGSKRMSHDGLLSREMNMIEGFKHVAPYWSKYWKETLWCFSASSNFLENHHHFWGDQVTVLFFLKIFQGRNKGGFLCGLEAAALVPSEPAEELLDEQEKPVVEKPGKRWQTWQNTCAGRGWDGNSLKPKVFCQTCLFEILRKFDTDSLEICTLMSLFYRWVVQAPSRCATPNSYVNRRVGWFPSLLEESFGTQPPLSAKIMLGISRNFKGSQ